MLHEDPEQAAVARRKLYRARADRPQQRNSKVTHGGRPAATFATEFRFMTGGDVSPEPGMIPTGGSWVSDQSGPTDVDSIFMVGLASSTGRGYEMWDSAGPYTEIIAPGAFQKSLALGSELDVPLVLEHDAIRRIARTTIPWGQPGALQLAENDAGLVCRAQLDPNDIDVQYLLPKMRTGLLNEMSFRFSIDSGEWSPDYSQYVIHSANIQRGDVSLVGFGASPFTMAALANRTKEPLEVRAFVVRDDDLR